MPGLGQAIGRDGPAKSGSDDDGIEMLCGCGHALPPCSCGDGQAIADARLCRNGLPAGLFGALRAWLPGAYRTTRSAFGNPLSTTQPSSVTATRSSMRTPTAPGT